MCVRVSACQCASNPGFYRRMGATEIGETDASFGGVTRKLPRLKIEP